MVKTQKEGSCGSLLAPPAIVSSIVLGGPLCQLCILLLSPLPSSSFGLNIKGVILYDANICMYLFVHVYNFPQSDLLRLTENTDPELPKRL